MISYFKEQEQKTKFRRKTRNLFDQNKLFHLKRILIIFASDYILDKNDEYYIDQMKKEIKNIETIYSNISFIMFDDLIQSLKYVKI